MLGNRIRMCMRMDGYILRAAPIFEFIISRKFFCKEKSGKNDPFRAFIELCCEFLFQIDGDIMDKKVLLKCLAAHFYVCGSARAIYRKWYDFHDLSRCSFFCCCCSLTQR